MSLSSASWDKFLNPELLKKNFVQAGLYLAAFELLKQSLIGRPRDFFWNGFKNGKEIISSEYQEEVLSLSKHKYEASSLWWQQQGAIDRLDVERLTEIREHRDLIAHEMPKLIGSAEHSIRLDLLGSIAGLLAKIDNWWIVNVEIATDPDVREYTKNDLDGAASMSSIFLSMMLPIAEGDDSKMRSLYETWIAYQSIKESKSGTQG